MDGGGGQPARGFLDEILHPYKAGQGVITRRIAYWSGAGLSIWGARDLWIWLQGFGALQAPLLKAPILNLDLSHFPLGGPAISLSVVLAAGVGLAGWICGLLVP
jgi:hypothetical protein